MNEEALQHFPSIICRSEEERSALAACLVQLLKTVRAAWPEYYAKLQLYLRGAYWDNQFFSIPAMVDRAVSGSVEMDALRGYKMLAAHQLLAPEMTHSLDAAALLDQLFSELPQDAHTLARQLSPERVEQLAALVDLLCTLAPAPALEAFATKLAAEEGDTARAVWFLQHLGGCLAPQLLARADNILSAALTASDGRFLRLLAILVRLCRPTAATQTTAAHAPLVKFISHNWERIVGSLESRTDAVRTIFVVQTLGRLVSQEAEVRRVVSDWFCRLLRHPTLDYKVKVKAFRLLGLLIAAESNDKRQQIEKDNEELKSALQSFGALHLPVHSHELPDDSLEQNLYKNLFRHVLAVFEMAAAKKSGLAGVLLYFLISVAAREPEHVLEMDIQASLARAMAAAVDGEMALLGVPWAIYADTSGLFTPSVRLACLSRFLLPLGTAASPPALTRFFTQHMAALLTGITAEVRGGSSDAVRTATLTQKIGAVQLFGLLYARLDQTALHSPGAPLVGLAANILRQQDLFKGKGDGKVRKSKSVVNFFQDTKNPIFQQYKPRIIAFIIFNG
jgi:hypothetical protein